MAHAQYLGTKSFGALDGLRAVSIVAVVWHHCGWTSDQPVLLSRGFLGVDLFFVISGFLIVTLLLREQDTTGRISLRGFYARRALRIVPLYYAVLLACLGIALASSSLEARRLREDLPWAFLYLTNWVPPASLLAITWSLAAEEQFYVTWPSVMARARRRAVELLVLALVVFGGIQLVHKHGTPLPLPGFLCETSFFPILLGVALAYALHDPRGHALASRLVGWRLAPCAAAALVLTLLALPYADLSGVARMAVHVGLLLLVAACVVREDHAAATVLRLAPVLRVGVLSYGIYLLHPFCRHVAAKVLGDGESSLPLFGATLVLTVLAAEVSYRLFESRFLALKSRFAPAKSTGSIQPIAPERVPAALELVERFRAPVAPSVGPEPERLAHTAPAATPAPR